MREADTHKGTYGRLLIVAGSVGMSGAACLAAKAAVRGGAGLVTVASPADVQPVIAAKTTEATSMALPQATDGGLAPECVGMLMERLNPSGSVLLLGPGLGSQPSTAEVVTNLLGMVDTRVVLDADGLNCLAQMGETASRLEARAATTILTPHPGEMSRLLGRKLGDRLTEAREFAAASRSVLILKGAGTVVSDGTHSYVNLTGNPGMATGGTGDVLAGLLGALVALGLPSIRAAILATYLHGLAGDCAAGRFGAEALAASDLIRALPVAWKRWRRGALDAVR